RDDLVAAPLHAAFGAALDPLEHQVELADERVDLAAHEQELALDVLDRVALRHQAPDQLDLPDDRRGVEPLRAAVLALAADAHAAREQAELDVLAERRLAQRLALAPEQLDHLLGREPLGVRGLERRELVLGPACLLALLDFDI